MRYDWILEVLTDLRAYSQANGLKALAAQIEESLRVAETEIGQQREGSGLLVADPVGNTGGAQTGGG